MSMAIGAPKLSAALVQATADLSNPAKDKTARIQMKGGGSFSYAYADLAAILTQVRPILQRHGLAVVQHTITTEHGVGVVTMLIHESGERMESAPLAVNVGNDPQQVGAAITYLRRYQLCGVLGIAADEDTDASSSRTTSADPQRDSLPSAAGAENPDVTPGRGDTSGTERGTAHPAPDPGPTSEGGGNARQGTIPDGEDVTEPEGRRSPSDVTLDDLVGRFRGNRARSVRHLNRVNGTEYNARTILDATPDQLAAALAAEDTE